MTTAHITFAVALTLVFLPLGLAKTEPPGCCSD